MSSIWLNLEEYLPILKKIVYFIIWSDFSTYWRSVYKSNIWPVRSCVKSYLAQFTTPILANTDIWNRKEKKSNSIRIFFRKWSNCGGIRSPRLHELLNWPRNMRAWMWIANSSTYLILGWIFSEIDFKRFWDPAGKNPNPKNHKNSEILVPSQSHLCLKPTNESFIKDRTVYGILNKHAFLTTFKTLSHFNSVRYLCPTWWKGWANGSRLPEN